MWKSSDETNEKGPLRVLIDLLLFLPWLGIQFLILPFDYMYRVLTGEERREREEAERRERDFSEAAEKFEQDVARDAFPDEMVLNRFESCSDMAPKAIQTRFGSCSYREAVELIRRERNAELEMQRVGCEYGKVAEQFSSLVSLASLEWDETVRTANAFLGTRKSVSFSRTLVSDIIHIASSLGAASGVVTDTLAYLVQKVCCRMSPVNADECFTIESCRRGLSAGTNAPIEIPTLKILQSFHSLDVVKASHFEADMAVAYSVFLEQAEKCVPRSSAVAAVKNKYLSIIVPMIASPVEPQFAEPPRMQSGNIAGKQGLLAVAGMSSLKAQLQEEVVEVFRDPDKYKKYGISIPNGILFFGPPGCGKTYIARQLAAELGYKYFEIAPSDVGSSYVHGTALKIRETFDEAAKKAPSILFIDEFEALVPSRDSVGSGHQYKAEEVNEFLTQMGGCADRRVLLIAATNQPWEIDSAVQRAGRLDKKIYVAPPDLTARGEILAHHLNGRYTSPDLDTEVMASQLSGYSSSDLKLLVDEAAKLAFKADEPISEKHIVAAKSIVPPSISSEEEVKYQQFAARGITSSRAKAGFQN